MNIDLYSLAAFIALGLASITALLAIAIRRCNRTTLAIALVGTFSSFGIILWQNGPAIHLLLLLATGAVMILLHDYQETKTEAKEEAYVLLLLSSLGAMILATATHFAYAFLGLQLLSIPVYGLIAYFREEEHSLEAAVKYVLLAGVSIAFMLFGIALIYSQTGTLTLGKLDSQNSVILGGLAMVLVGFAFKISAAPFHMWTADVYQGSPSPVTAYLATVSKGASLFFLVRLCSFAEITPILMVLSIASMFVGNLLALLQQNIKRLLAYSSIGHIGYMLVVLQLAPAVSHGVLLFYLTTYFASVLAAFSILVILGRAGKEPSEIKDFTGLAATHPWLAGGFSLAMLSLIGIPLTAGFFGKYFILAASAQTAQWPLLFCLITASSIGLYAYLRVIIACYQSPPVLSPFEKGGRGISPITTPLLAFLCLLILTLGLYPEPLKNLLAPIQ